MLSAVKQKSLQLFSEHVQRNIRRSQFSWQTVPNYRAMYSKATAAVGCPCTWHNELACCGGSQVGSSRNIYFLQLSTEYLSVAIYCSVTYYAVVCEIGLVML